MMVNTVSGCLNLRTLRGCRVEAMGQAKGLADSHILSWSQPRGGRQISSTQEVSPSVQQRQASQLTMLEFRTQHQHHL